MSYKNPKTIPFGKIKQLPLPGWSVHTPNLLEEVLSNPGAAALNIPINILGKILYAVAERAGELNDEKLNALMMQLTLYSVADPESPDYDVNIVAEHRKLWSN